MLLLFVNTQPYISEIPRNTCVLNKNCMLYTVKQPAIRQNKVNILFPYY